MTKRPVELVWMLVTLILALMAIWPLLYMLGTAVKPGSEVFEPTMIAENATVQNFAYVLTEVPFWLYLLNTFFVASVVTVISLFLHTMAGYAL